MNISQANKVLPILMEKGVVPFLWGHQGVGKTQTIEQIGLLTGRRVIHLHLATQEPGDVVGLLVKNEDGTVRHARPEWFPTDPNVILFLDEFNRAPMEVIQTTLPLVGKQRSIHTHKLPEGAWIVAAGNYDNNTMNVTSIADAALMSRFCHLDFVPTNEEFILHLEKKGHDTLASFFRVHPEMIEVNSPERPVLDTITPDRRAWCEAIGVLDKEPALDSCRYEIYSGLVGKTAASSYTVFKKNITERLSGKDVLEKYKDVRGTVLAASSPKSSRFDVLNTAVEEILARMSLDRFAPQEIDNFKQFMLDIPLEMSLKIIKKTHDLDWAQKNEVLNNKEFVEKFKHSKLEKETAAKAIEETPKSKKKK